MYKYHEFILFILKYTSVHNYYGSTIWGIIPMQWCHWWIDAIHTYFTSVFYEDVYIYITSTIFKQKIWCIKLVWRCTNISFNPFSFHMKQKFILKYAWPWVCNGYKINVGKYHYTLSLSGNFQMSLENYKSKQEIKYFGFCYIWLHPREE